MVKSKLRRGMFWANNVDPYIPEWWAMETLAILYEEMVSSALVNRDYEKYFNKFGDVVNTRRPNEFTGRRKAKGDALTTQDLNPVNVAVTMDQWCTVSFIIDDLEETMSMKKLSKEYAEPAAKALARMVDRTVLGQYPRFLPNVAGSLNNVTESNIKGYLIDLRKQMNDQKAYQEGRNLILTNKTEGDCLRPEWFTSADKVGDGGRALKNANLGTKLGMNFYNDLNMADVAVGNTSRTFQVNNATGYLAGATAITVDTGTGEILPGSWVSLDGIPYQVASRTGTAPTTAIVLTYGLRRAVLNDAPIVVYTPGAVNQSVATTGYPAGWNKEIVVDGFTVAPQVGQFVTFGTAADRYTIIDVNGLVGITLDRSLAAAIADDALVCIGPAGAYNLCIHRDAITLAIRGLAPVVSGAGAISTTQSMNGMSMRVTISYDPLYQKHRWTLDFLAGIQVLDTNLGAVLLG